MRSSKYRWRQLTEAERAEVLAHRKLLGRPWHSPPHRPNDGHTRFHVTAACYEHRPWIGSSSTRLETFSHDLLEVVSGGNAQVFAWCVLPNHYHLLVETPSIPTLLRELGRFHGRTSHAWNGEDDERGRSVLFRAVERALRSERHFWATLNYVHHNPVHHGYVERWTDWPWSSGDDFLERTGREEAERVWREFPILDYGQGWDDPAL